MNSRRLIGGLCAIVLVVCGVGIGAASPGPGETNPFAAADAQILAQIAGHSQVMESLEYLSDRIGPRLTGSEQLKKANEWTAELMRGYGLVNVHLEPWTIARSWTRGEARARIVAPAEHPLTIASAGWAPGTGGAVRGPVVREVSREIEGRHRHLSAAGEPFAAASGGPRGGVHPSDAAAAGAVGRSRDSESV
ncbi:MAG: hypothetical protein LAN71_14620 [Acidobacteriia bacterium]|nr:hypothetical protein [Terriglobia bacterium]